MVDTCGSGRSPTRSGISSSWYVPISARCQLSNDGVADPNTSGMSAIMARRRRDVTGVITGRGVLLESRLVLFVNDDQPQVRQGSKHRTAGSHHHLHVATPQCAAIPHAVPRRSDDCAAPPPPQTDHEIADGLRRQADLRHQNNRLTPKSNHILDRLNVNFRLAGPRDSANQQRTMFGGVQRRGDGVERLPADRRSASTVEPAGAIRCRPRTEIPVAARPAVIPFSAGLESERVVQPTAAHSCV